MHSTFHQVANFEGRSSVPDSGWRLALKVLLTGFTVN